MTRNSFDLVDDAMTAARVFGSPLRVALLRHYARHPGPQARAVTALGESSANVSRNTEVLTAAGAVIVTTDAGKTLYRVDAARVLKLTSALTETILS